MKITASYVAVAILLGLCLHACTKKEQEPEPTPEPAPAPKVYNGLFSSSINAAVQGTSLNTYFTSEFAVITFSTLNHNTTDLSGLVDAGKVTLNGVGFERPINTMFYYTDSSHSNPFTPPHIWSVTGSTTIPAFTFTNTNTYPIFEGYRNLPDSFQSSTGPVIPITKFSNVDEIEAHFITTLGKTTASRFFPGNTDTIRFTTADLAPVGPHNSVTLYLTFYKNNIQVINGNNYVFQTAYMLRKNGIKYN